MQITLAVQKKLWLLATTLLASAAALIFTPALTGIFLSGGHIFLFAASFTAILAAASATLAQAIRAARSWTIGSGAILFFHVAGLGAVAWAAFFLCIFAIVAISAGPTR